MRYFLLLVVILALTVSVSLAKGKGKGKDKGKDKEPKEPKPCMVLDDTGAEVKMGKKKLDKCKKNEDCTDGPHDNENGDGTFLFFCQSNEQPKPCKVLDADGKLIKMGKQKKDQCKKPEKCEDGPHEDTNEDGETVQLYFCAEEEEMEPCRIVNAAGEDLVNRDCEMENETCSGGPKDEEDEDGNPIQLFFCHREERKHEKLWIVCLAMNMTGPEPAVLQNVSHICARNATCSIGPFTSPDGDIEVYFCTEYGPPPPHMEGEGDREGGMSKEGGMGKEGGKGKEGGMGKEKDGKEKMRRRR